MSVRSVNVFGSIVNVLIRYVTRSFVYLLRLTPIALSLYRSLSLSKFVSMVQLHFVFFFLLNSSLL